MKEKTIKQELAEFYNRERIEAEEAVQKEKKQVSINPNTYIAKEIKYQTALLKEILEELRRLK